MFTWNVEEMKLLNMDHVGEGYNKTFACESEVSIEDKFEFVDRMQDGKLSYFVDLLKGFRDAVPYMNRDVTGYPTDYARKAWVRKNDTQGLICRTTDTYGKYGDFNILGCRVNLFAYHIRIVTEVTKGDVFEDWFINDLFHRQLEECKDKEYDYFYSQDITAQYLTDFENKYEKHGFRKIQFEEDYRLHVELAENESDKSRVIFENYEDYSDTELTLEEVQQIDAELTALDDLYNQFQEAQKVYEEARLAVAKKIKSMATN